MKDITQQLYGIVFRLGSESPAALSIVGPELPRIGRVFPVQNDEGDSLRLVSAPRQVGLEFGGRRAIVIDLAEAGMVREGWLSVTKTVLEIFAEHGIDNPPHEWYMGGQLEAADWDDTSGRLFDYSTIANALGTDGAEYWLSSGLEFSFESDRFGLVEVNLDPADEGEAGISFQISANMPLGADSDALSAEGTEFEEFALGILERLVPSISRQEEA